MLFGDVSPIVWFLIHILGNQSEYLKPIISSDKQIIINSEP